MFRFRHCGELDWWYLDPDILHLRRRHQYTFTSLRVLELIAPTLSRARLLPDWRITRHMVTISPLFTGTIIRASSVVALVYTNNLNKKTLPLSIDVAIDTTFGPTEQAVNWITRTLYRSKTMWQLNMIVLTWTGYPCCRPAVVWKQTNYVSSGTTFHRSWIGTCGILCVRLLC